MKHQLVMIFGTFDLFHEGHKSFIQQAREVGDSLYVVIARDCNVYKVKGKYPAWDETKRCGAVAKHLKDGEMAFLGDKNDFYKPILRHKPHIIALGYDQSKGVDYIKKELESFKFIVDVIRLKAYKPDVYKSSKIQRLLGG